MTKRVDRLLGLALSLVLGLALGSGCGEPGPADDDGNENASGRAGRQASGGRGGASGSRTTGGGKTNSGGNQAGGRQSNSGGRAGGDAPLKGGGGQAGTGGMRRSGGGSSTSEPARAPFFPDAFPADCVPDAILDRPQTDGHHRADEDCMTSGCHFDPKPAKHLPETDCRGVGCHPDGSPDGSGAPAFLFGGTVYRAATMAPAPGVQVGVRDTHGFYSACSAENGNFWYLAPSDVTFAWSSATARLRDANGGASMTTTPAAGCSATSCHTEKTRITAPAE